MRECPNCHCDLSFYGLPTRRNPKICGNCGKIFGDVKFKAAFSQKDNAIKQNQEGECMDEFEKETLKFFEDVVSAGLENQFSISVDDTIIEYFKVAIKAIQQNDKDGECMTEEEKKIKDLIEKYDCGLIDSTECISKCHYILIDKAKHIQKKAVNV